MFVLFPDPVCATAIPRVFRIVEPGLPNPARSTEAKSFTAVACNYCRLAHTGLDGRVRPFPGHPPAILWTEAAYQRLAEQMCPNVARNLGKSSHTSTGNTT